MQARRWVATGSNGLDDFALVTDEVPAPGLGEVTVEVRAAGVNPADLKHTRRAAPADFPLPVGYEVSGVIAAIGEGAEIASGGGAVGDPVVAFRVTGGYATALTVSAAKVFAKPASLPDAAAANLLLAGTTAADMLHTVRATAGDTIVVHGASGAVGVAVLQLARMEGITVVGVAGPQRLAEVERFGGIPVERGERLADRIRAAAAAPIVAALDTTGTDAAIDAALALVSDRSRIVTIAAPARAAADGFAALAGNNPASAVFRDAIRADLIRLAGEVRLVVPVSHTYPLDEARAALDLVAAGRAGGKVALLA